MRKIRDQNKEMLAPVEVLPVAIEELERNERYKKSLPGRPQGKPDHFTALLPYHELVYGPAVDVSGWKVRSERKIHDNLKSGIKKKFIPLYEQGEFAFSQLLKLISHLIYWEERLKGKIFAPSWKEIKKASKNKLFEKTFHLHFHRTKNKKVRKKYIDEVKDYLTNG